MPEKRFSGGSMLVGDHYKAGDSAPTGYLDWHEWAEAQHKAGLRQKECGKCGKWKYPQELSTNLHTWFGRTAKGIPVRVSRPMCHQCSPAASEERNA